MSKTHKLKIDLDKLQDLICDEKKSEIRLNDRNYQKFDTIIFQGQVFQYQFVITHIETYPKALKDDYVVLSLDRIS